MSNYRKIKTIISHEFMSKVKNKWFIIATLLGPLLMLVMIALPSVIMFFTMQSTTQRVAMIDKTQTLGKLIEKGNEDIIYLSNASEEELKDSLRKDLIPSFIVVDSQLIDNANITMYSKGSGGLSINEKIEESLRSVRVTELLKEAGIEKAVFDNIRKSVSIQELTVSDDKHKADESSSSNFQVVLAYIAAFAIYMMMIIYGQQVMSGVIEEKANRIIEIIASSAKPFEIMFGKVIGIGLVGMVQMTFWVVLSLLLMSQAAPILNSMGMDAVNASQMSTMSPEMMSSLSDTSITIPSISPLVVFALFFFFVTGYFIYASLYAGVGASVDQEKDAAQIVAPLGILLVIPIMMISAIITDPNSTTSVVLSLIPFFSPILMLARIIITNGALPMWQVLLSVVLCLLTFIGSVWVAAKIYRIGILIYGKKPTLGEIFKWIVRS